VCLNLLFDLVPILNTVLNLYFHLFVYVLCSVHVFVTF